MLVDSSIIPYTSEELFYFVTKNITYLCGVLAFRKRLIGKIQVKGGKQNEDFKEKKEKRIIN